MYTVCLALEGTQVRLYCFGLELRDDVILYSLSLTSFSGASKVVANFEL